jgi:hypothetical protein
VFGFAHSGRAFFKSIAEIGCASSTHAGSRSEQQRQRDDDGSEEVALVHGRGWLFLFKQVNGFRVGAGKTRRLAIQSALHLQGFDGSVAGIIPFIRLTVV